MDGRSGTGRILSPYLPRIVASWLHEAPDETAWRIEGSVAFVDVSGFTRLSEQLARSGKVGAEVLTEALDSSFTQLLSVAYAAGGSLLKFGGDALLLLFDGSEHEARACSAAVGMRRMLREIGRIDTGRARPTTLRMSVGIHSGAFQFFLVGRSHRELIVTGPDATETVVMESTAEAGEIVVSPRTAQALPGRTVGEPKGTGYLLRSDAPVSSGEGLVVPPSREGVDLSVAVPEAIREHLLAGGHEPEHRQATVAFVHFDGADRLIERQGPDALAAALGDLVGLAQEAAEAQAVSFLGTDISRDGGKIILVAGAPRAGGDDEERMLLAVRRLVEADTPLPVRVGLNRGHVFAGDVGPSYRRTYTVMGDAVNLAARLMAAADPGHVLTTEGVLQRSRTRFRATALPPLLVKGKARPVHACDVGPVVAVRAGARRDRGLPLVGREREMSVLLEALESARGGTGRAVEVVGEPGIGKSRLVHELRAAAGGTTVLQATCDRYGASTPYYPFRHLLRELLGVERGDAPERLLTRLRDRVEHTSPDLLPWIPLLGIPLDVALPPTRETEALEERFLQAKVAEVTAAFLAVALPASVLVVLEDVQWMDEASSGLLRGLAREAGRRAWLVVATRRETGAGFEAGEEEGWVGLRLAPLETDEANALLEAATEDAPLPRHRLAAAAERADGNPLFLLELLSALQAGGDVESLPDSIEATVTAKIDSLAPPDRSLLRTAAVLGVHFREDLLPAVLEEGQGRDRVAVWRRLDEFIGPGEAGTLRFRSPLVRDVAYEALPFRRRQHLHARVGDIILATSDSQEENAEILAMHFFHGQRFAEAWRFARLAGERARRKWANVEAAKSYRRALEAARRASGIDPYDLGEVLEALGDVRRQAGEFRAAHHAYSQARRILTAAPVSVARLLYKEARIAERLGRYSEALRWIHRGHRLLDGVEGQEAAGERAQLSVLYAAMRQAQGRHAEAARWCERAIREAEDAGEREALAHAYYILDWVHVTQGRSDGNEHSWKALEIYEELDDLPGQAVVLNNLGAFAYFEGRWNEALELYERGRAARDLTGDEVNAAYGTSNIGEILSDQGRLGEAERMFRDALWVWRAAGDRSGVAFVLGQLGKVAARAGRFDEALGLLEQAGAEFLDVGDKTSVVEASARTAECLVLRGDAEQALAAATEAVALAEAMGGMSVHMPLLHRVRGFALMQLGRAGEAAAALEESLRMGRVRRAEYEVALTLRAIAQLARLEGRYAPETERESDDILERLGVVHVPSVPGVPEPAGRGSGKLPTSGVLVRN